MVRRKMETRSCKAVGSSYSNSLYGLSEFSIPAAEKVRGRRVSLGMVGEEGGERRDKV